MTQLSQFINLLSAKLQGADAEFQGVSIDSRTIKPGELFIAIAGDQFDGHAFIEQAQQNGASAAIVNKAVKTELPLLIVSDTRIALGKLAAIHRQQFNIPIVALTGSCGKTTTKEMLRSILEICGPVLAPVKSFNNDIGAPLTLLQLNKQHQFAVMELGANHPGEIAYLTEIVKPSLAFILNVAPAHMLGFGSIEGVMQAKSEIFSGLVAGGTAMINADDQFAPQWNTLLKDHRIVTFGVKESADYSAENIQRNTEGYYEFTLVTPAGRVAIQLPLLGEHYILNAIAAAAAAHNIGASLEAIKTGLATVQPVNGRLKLKQGQVGARILDDTYNAIPYAVAASLQVLAQYAGERIFIFGGMREIGEQAEAEHARIGELAKQLGIQKLYACGEWCDVTVKAFGEGGHYFSTQNELSDAVRTILQPNVTLLVKGSRSSKMENVVQALLATH